MKSDYDLQIQLIPCSHCGRKFAADNLGRHQNICQKTSRKRPVFDSSKQRVIDAGDAKYHPQKVANSCSVRKKPSLSKTSNQSSWRQKHEELLQAVRAARKATIAVKEGKKLPPPPPPTINPDYIQCPHCLRRFNQTAAERHIKFCAEQAKRLQNRKPISSNITAQAALRASARQKYRPPLPQSSKRKSEVTFDLITNDDAENKKKGTISLKNDKQSLHYRPKMRNSEWDSSIDHITGFRDVRTKTGLRPSSGLSDASLNNITCKQSVVNRNKKPSPSVRKVASKRVGFSNVNSVRLHSSNFSEVDTGQYSRQDKSTENDYSICDEEMPYAASMYKSSSTNRYQLVNGSKKPTILKKSNFSRQQSESNHQVTSNIDTNGYGNKLNGNHIKSFDLYNWSESAENMSKVVDSVYQKKNGSKLPSKFCHECGSRYPITNAKFCCECGVRRIIFN